MSGHEHECENTGNVVDIYACAKRGFHRCVCGATRMNNHAPWAFRASPSEVEGVETPIEGLCVAALEEAYLHGIPDESTQDVAAIGLPIRAKLVATVRERDAEISRLRAENERLQKVVDAAIELEARKWAPGKIRSTYVYCEELEELQSALAALTSLEESTNG